MIPGHVTDYGDFIRVEQWLLKGKRPNLVWRIGAPVNTTPADRTPGPPRPRNGKADIIMDLRADQKVPLSLGFTDEMGNPTEPPATYTAAYTVDDPSIINLTDNGDGTAEAAATGTLGNATVSVTVTWEGRTLTGDLQIIVVSGLAERLNVVAGEPTETTPDEVPA